MLFRGDIDARNGRHARAETDETFDAVAALAAGNPDRELVLSHVARMVADGLAAWNIFDNGEIEVRFNTGETFIFAETTVLRLA